MKAALVIMLCSAIYGDCMPPVQMKPLYDSYYECLVDGYTKAIEKQEEIGRKETNTHEIYTKFYCKYVPGESI